jgi:hypothetical protein
MPPRISFDGALAARRRALRFRRFVCSALSAKSALSALFER